jgi:hypothetical protein
MKFRMMLPLLLVSTVFVAPASANWFHNPYENINRNVGSAPNPTPQDLREMRLPIVVKVGVPVQGYTVLEPPQDVNQTASAAPQPVTPAPQGGAGVVAAASPSR